MTRLFTYRILISFLFFAAFHCTTNAQSVAVNTTGATANSSSILDVSSTTKGLLTPRMTKTEKNAITTPATGLLVYQSSPDSIGFHYYDGSKWVWISNSNPDIIRQTVLTEIPNLGANDIRNFNIAVAGATVGSTVNISPSTALFTGSVIGYAFVSAANVVTIYVGNVTTTPIGTQTNVTLYVSVIR